MKLLEEVKQKLIYLNDCSAAFVVAHAAWSACDHRELPGPSALSISATLDNDNIHLIGQLQQITTNIDYSNDDQAEMLRWLNNKGYSRYIAKQVKVKLSKLVDWA